MFLFALIPAGSAETVPATHKQGSMHGFLLLQSADGKAIAVGDQINIAHGNGVRSRLVFHFRDGSIDDDVTEFRQAKTVELISDHHIQKGPSFPKPMDVTIRTATGQITYREDKDGAQELKTEHMDLPPDLANGLMSVVLENLPVGTAAFKVSYLVASPKPRIVKFSIQLDGQDSFRVAGSARKAKRYRIHVELGGVAAVVAPILGKQPADLEMWVMDGEVPAFLKVRGPMYEQGPDWTMKLLSPGWPQAEEPGASPASATGR